LLLVLPLKLLLPPLGIGRSARQATGVLLGHLLSPMHLYKLALEKGDLLSKALCILMSKS
jgi:hypothetical protein